MCSCKVGEVQHRVWARFHWWGYPGSLAFSVRCVVIFASFPRTVRQLLSSTPSWLPYSRSCRHPKSLVNLEARLPKSIFSWQHNHYWARTEVKATNVLHSGKVSERQGDAAVLTRLTSAIHYFQSGGHYPSWAHALYLVTLHRRIDFKNQGLFNKGYIQKQYSLSAVKLGTRQNRKLIQLPHPHPQSNTYKFILSHQLCVTKHVQRAHGLEVPLPRLVLTHILLQLFRN